MDSQAFLSFDGRFLAGWLGIILVDIVLSGDNALAVAIAARSLAPEKRLQGILMAVLGAVCLRVGFTWYAAQLMQIPFLKLAGGAVILWIAVRLLVEKAGGEIPAGKVLSLRHAVRTILLADAAMSLDNVLAVAGVSGGEAVRLWGSLGLTIPLVIAASAFVYTLMDRFPFLLYAGAVLLAKAAGGMIVSDPGISAWLQPHDAALKLPAEILSIAAVFLAAREMRRRIAARLRATARETRDGS